MIGLLCIRDGEVSSAVIFFLFLPNGKLTPDALKRSSWTLM